jgi:predicted AAA+ superfamily ATPase
MNKQTRTALLDWNLWGTYAPVLKERDSLEQRLDHMLQNNKLVVLTGVRRCGKSSLVIAYLNRMFRSQNLKPDQTLILNFEDPRLSAVTAEQLLEIIEDTKVEFSINPKIILFDEIQEIKDWPKAVRTLYDTKPYQIIVTGSNSQLLSSEYSSALSGRYVVLPVYPLSFQEILAFRGIDFTQNDLYKNGTEIRKCLKEYLEFGGFPEIVISPNKKEKLLVYFDTIIIKDNAERLGSRNTAMLREMAKYLLTNISNPTSYNNLAKIFEIGVDTAKRYCEAFEESYLIFGVPKFDYSVKKQIVNPKKIYAIDPGLRNMVGFVFSEDSGRLMENIVYLELKRRGKDVFYWKNKKELDFVAQEGKSQQLINVAYEVNDRELDSLEEAMQVFNAEKTYLITYNTEDTITKSGKTIEVVPIYRWLLER